MCDRGAFASPGEAPTASQAVSCDTGRRETIADFLAESGCDGLEPVPLAGDASFRRYYRVRGNGRRAVLMDAPSPQEDVVPFITVSRFLRRLGFSAPEVYAEDRTRGFLLLEDLGDDTYTRLLDRGVDEPALYTLAVDTLIALQRAVGAAGPPELPPYDTTRLLAEAALLADWYQPAISGIPLEPGLREEYLALWRAVLPLAVVSPPTLVLRDYHVDNLMLLAGRPGVQGCGLLDFQDAVSGPSSYDLVSLLEDARRDIPAALQQEMTERSVAPSPGLIGLPFFILPPSSPLSATARSSASLRVCGSVTASRNISRTFRGSGVCSSKISDTPPWHR